MMAAPDGVVRSIELSFSAYLSYEDGLNEHGLRFVDFATDFPA